MFSMMAALAVIGMGLVISFSIGYLLVLLMAAALVKPSPKDQPASAERFVVLIPAHNEELVIAETLKSLVLQEYSKDAFEVVVIADNCSDSTAQICRSYGVTVLERTNTEERGKGYALDWAIQQLIARQNPAAAFAIVDADTWVAPDFLTRAAGHISNRNAWSKMYALQGRYGVENSADGWRAALMSAAFDLFNHVKPCGREALGLSVGLKGNGMVFTLPLMQQARWSGKSVTEDIDFGVALAREHRLRVAYEPSAVVKAQMPITAQQATTQRRRWEIGRYQLVKEKGLPLLWEGLRSRNVLILDAGIDLMILPMGELVALSVLWSAITFSALHVLWHASLLVCGLTIGTCWAALFLYILWGLRVAGAGPEAYKSLLFAPGYVVWKLLLYGPSFAAKLSKRKDQSGEWIRTERKPLGSASELPVREAAAAEGETVL